jgi:predicted nucleotidyltransferase
MIPAPARLAIDAALAALEREHDLRVLFAVESGSRAWGFASADSDFDVRLVYARHRDWYLSIDLEHKADTVEVMLPGDIDLAGWDVRKALGLFAKSNPPLIEWLDSPVVYRDDGVFRNALRELLPDVYSPAACLYHYTRMARRTVNSYLGKETVKRKKYLYVLRPLLAARWIEQGRGPVPMRFDELFVTLGPEHAAVRAAIDELVREKVAGGELGAGPPVAVLEAFIHPEHDRLQAVGESLPKAKPDRAKLDELFRRTIGA